MRDQGARGLMLAGPYTLEWLHSSLLVEHGDVSSLHCSPRCNVGAFRDSLGHSWSVLMTQTETPHFQFPPQSESHTGRASIPFRSCHHPVPTYRGTGVGMVLKHRAQAQYQDR